MFIHVLLISNKSYFMFNSQIMSDIKLESWFPSIVQ